MGPVARKLQIGFESFRVINQPKTDVNLRFSSSNMQRLAALLHPSEAEEFLLLWKPQPNCRRRFDGLLRPPLSDPVVKGLAGSQLGVEDKVGGCGSPKVGGFLIKTAVGGSSTGGSSSSSGSSDGSGSGSLDTTGPSRSSTTSKPAAASPALAPAACGSSSGRTSLDGGQDPPRTDSSAGQPEPTSEASTPQQQQQQKQQQQRGAQLSPAAVEALQKMRMIPVEWRTFHINLGAYLYCSLFKMAVPPNELAISKPEVMQWLNIKPQDSTIRHQFVLYK
jgi:hypothetical protein